MKRTLLLLFFCTVNSIASVYSQKVTLNLLNVKFSQAISEISKQANVEFAYSKEVVDLNRIISIAAINTDLRLVLDQLLNGTDLVYIELDGKIYLGSKSFEGVNPLNSIQLQKISGLVSDSTSGEPISEAYIIAVGTNTAATTNVKGEFSIDVPKANATLQISYVGYCTKKITITGQTVVYIQLTPDIKKLDEIVVIGYGTALKRDLTGAISSINISKLNIVSDISIGDALAGKISGLQINQISAQPGGDMSFQIRGATSMEAGNSPLFIVDGFPITGLNESSIGTMGNTGVTSTLNFLNPNDIESVDVLKDASATAIYGARASNGVVIITTKRGKEGKPRIEYSSSFSVQNIAKKYDVLNATEYMQEYNSMTKESFMINQGVYPYGTKTFDEAQVTAKKPYSDKYSAYEIANPPVNTDWIDLVTQQGAIQQNNLSISGGSETTKYSFSGNYFKNDGVVKKSGIQRFGGRLNLDHNVGKYITTGLNLSISKQRIKNIRLGPELDREAGVIGAAVVMSPLVLPIDADGNYPLDPNSAFMPNPYSLLTRTDDSEKDELLGNLFVELKPITDLRLRANFGINRGIAQRGTYAPRTTVEGSQNAGKASLSELNKADYLTEFTIDYSKNIAIKHNFRVLAGYSFQKFTANDFSITNTGYLSDNITYNAMGAAENRAIVSSNRADNLLVSFFGRINYNYSNKYLLTATIRRDGATRFANNNKWGTFPSVAVGWNVHEENFFKSISRVMNSCKIRVSYGQTGNSNIGSYAFGSYALRPAFVYGSRVTTGIFHSRLSNPNLKWETTTEYNIGFDFGFLKNRITGSIDIYNSIVSDLLRLNKPLQPYHEIPTIAFNAGKTQSKGLELSLSAQIVNFNNFKWTSSLTFSFYRDRWKERFDDWRPAVYESVNDPIRAWYGYENDGIMSIEEYQKYGAPAYFPQLLPGMVKIKDINGYKLDSNGNPSVDTNGKFMLSGIPDGKINDADMLLKGSYDPGYLAGMSHTMTYKKIDIGFNFYGVFYRNMVDPNFSTIANMPKYASNTNRLNMERWRYNDPNTKYPGLAQADAIYGYGDYMMQNAWYIRLKNINIAYNIPTRWTKSVVSKLRVFVDIQNLFTITPYTGVDPELDNASDNRLFIVTKTNSSAYPNAKIYTLGIDVGF